MYERKFSIPYKPLIDAGVKFYAALGNHDDDGQIQYKLFNMDGKKYYSFKPKNGVRFFALDTNVLDQAQLEWLERSLSAAQEPWKVAYFHHPIYSNGRRHGSNVELRVAKVLEAESVPKSKKLVKLRIDVGTEQRTIVAGIAEAYQPDQLVGRTIVVVANLKPAKLMGIESNGMVLAASPDGQAPTLISVDESIPAGTRVR